ncbi:hypothetical protein [Halolamina salifodinae]|uniref:Uncharacterized protein n=1 Tax=Halolamina salifodinae TaxID=1202767 RepID=A0A8T4GVQ3_9EURY|nr:hypothetical protein [Halolamina salifodinae]MBP1986979.1 hypothetical protein [Halolamina salifodinae]
MVNFSKLLALSIIALLLVGTVGPTMFVGDVTAADSSPPDEAADLLVFTAFEDKNGTPVKDTVYAVDPQTNETAWATALNASGTGNESAITVATDESADKIYALTIGDNNTVRAYAINFSGGITESHKLNLTTDQLGRFAQANNSTFYFNTPDRTYKFNFESDSMTEMYTYEMTPVKAYSMGLQDGQLQQAAYSPDLNTTFIYDGTNQTDNFKESVTRIQYTSQGYVYQTGGESYLEFRKNGNTTWSYVEPDYNLRAAASDGSKVYASVGDELRKYGTTANSNETVLHTANPSNETSHRLSTLEYDSGYLHNFETRQGTNLSTDTPTLIYRLYNTSTGDLVYETKISHDSNYHRSVAVVRDDGSSTVIAGGSEEYTLADILSEYLPSMELILGILALVVIGGIGLALLFKIFKLPVMILLYPFIIIWKISLWFFLLPFRIVGWLIDYAYPD